MSRMKVTNLRHESSAVDNIVLNADGTVGGELGSALAAKADTSALATAGGLVLITTQSFSAASAVNVNNCFSAAYEHYLVRVDIDASSANCDVNIRWRDSGTDNSATIYGTAWQGYNTSAGNEAGQTNLVAQSTIAKHFTGYTGFASIEVFAPFDAVYTMFKGHNVRQTAANEKGFLDISGTHQSSTSYDGFSLIPSIGTITGALRVYGYKNS